MDAVVLDLFGTLVDAPTSLERTYAAQRLAGAAGCRPIQVERYLIDTWQARHAGTLPTVPKLAEHLLAAVGSAVGTVEAVADELRALGRARLVPDASVVRTLTSLHHRGLRLGVLSDASAEVAAVWPESPLAALVHVAVFSCEAGSVKPDQLLYLRVCAEVGVLAERVLYVGDGGGNELRGATQSGMTAVAVRRRGPDGALAFRDTAWSGPTLATVEQVPAFLTELR